MSREFSSEVEKKISCLLASINLTIFDCGSVLVVAEITLVGVMDVVGYCSFSYSNLPNNRVGPFNPVGGRFFRN